MAGENRGGLSEQRRALMASRLQATTKPSEAAEESEEWVISYMDMVTVLMTVFLGMLAVMGMDGRLSNPTDQERADKAKVEEALEQRKPIAVVMPLPRGGAGEAATEATDGDSDEPTDATPPPRTPPVKPAKELSPGARQWLAKLEAMGLPPEVDISTSERKVSIVVKDRILFASGSATLQPEAVDLLRKLTPNLMGLPGTITVEGHSDDLAISTIRFPSNWELSAARAAAVVRTLEALGLPSSRLGAMGLANSRPLTVDPARRAENRRVEIVVDTDADTAQSATR